MNMPQNDHEKFEHFLKQFRPRAPRRLPIEKQERAARPLVSWALLATAALVSAVTVFLSVDRREFKRLVSGVPKLSTIKPLTSSQPLTLGRANALLVEAPSVQAAVDSLAFPSQTSQVPKGARSALAVLGEEDFKEKAKL
jgi:hypothetical protein